MKPELLVIFPLRPAQMVQLEERFTLHHLTGAADPEALVDAVGARLRGIVTNGERGASRSLLARCPHVEIVGCFGVGIDAIDREACAERGVAITNTPDVLTEDVADLALALLLAVLRRIPEADRYARAGRWLEAPFPLSARAGGRSAGIVGLGRIGKAIAKRLEAIGMRVAYHGRAKQDAMRLTYYADLVTMAHDVDVLVVCCPGGAATRGLVSAPVIEALGPQGWLVNVARGSVIDQDALVAALVENRIAGAGLDVFADEPRIPDALAGLDQVVLTPHVASATVETRDAMAQLVVDNLVAHFAGQPLLTPVR